MTDGRRVTGVVLGGGGARGSFEVGALRHLLEVAGIEVSVVAGCSVGASIAAKVATRRDNPGQLTALRQLEDVLRGFADQHGMFVEEPWFRPLLARLPQATTAFNQLRRRPAHDGARADGRGPGFHPGTVDTWTSLRTLVGAAREIEPSIHEAFRARSVYDLGPFRRLLADPVVFGLQDVAASSVSLRLPVVSLESGDLRYVTEAGGFVDRENAPLPRLGRVSLVDAVLASAAIPGIFPPVRLGDEHYVDGGVRSSLPIEVVLEHLCVSECYAIVAQPADVTQRDGMGDATILPIVARALGDIAMAEIRRGSLELARRNPAVTVIEPVINVHGALEVDPRLIAIAVDYGWMRAADAVMRLPEAQTAMSTAITAARMRAPGESRPPELVRLLEQRRPEALPPHLRGDPQAPPARVASAIRGPSPHLGQ